MFSIFRRKTLSEGTFRFKADRFWKWFAENEQFLRSLLEKKDFAEFGTVISAEVKRLGAGLAWVAGGQENSLTITGEGDPYKIFLAQYLVGRAPKIEGWQFFDSRQPGNLDEIQLKFGDLVAAGSEVWVSPGADNENEKVDINVWHPKWSSLNESQKYTITFLFLDAALGEAGTRGWIGKIDLSDAALKEAIPLKELPEYIAELSSRTGWKKGALGEDAVLYERKFPSTDFPRADVVIGSTMLPALCSDYLEADGKMKDPLPGSGADFVYLSIPREYFPAGGEVEARARIEDTLDKVLRESGHGRLIGGSIGMERGYVDFLLFDGSESAGLVVEEARRLGLPEGTRLEYFAWARRKDGREI